MTKTYLTVKYQEKNAAKAVGARWDAGEQKWFVPEGRDLAPFSQWLPPELRSAATESIATSGALSTGSRGFTAPVKKGVSLSSLLAGVSQAVSQAYRTGIWVLVEVVELRESGGHIFIGVSERDAGGAVLAKASAVIWQSTANTILPEFERATGAQLGTGIKLLVRARPVFKPQHGFSIEVDAIDPEYTLGDLEARKREIRERLKAEGVFAANKRLAAPWDFNMILVVAPEGGAGLGDFQIEADRLQHFGVCQFIYKFSRFQGEGAAREICDALQDAIANWGRERGTLPDAVVIIRGGGAVNDLAWLNDYDLARFICDLPVPVLTGIGHERDISVLDEVANTKFDTPSKVIAGIEQVIVKRTAEAKACFDFITARSGKATQTAKSDAESWEARVRSEASQHLAMGRNEILVLVNAIRLDAMQEVRSASELSFRGLQFIKTEANADLAKAKQEVPLFWGQVSLGIKHALHSANVTVGSLLDTVKEQSNRDLVRAKSSTDEGIAEVASLAKGNVRDWAARSEALMREIAGQGPEKTLSRGFALVSDQLGKPITRVSEIQSDFAIQIQFSDGKVSATTEI